MYQLSKLINAADPKTHYYMINEVGDDFHSPTLMLHENEMKQLVDSYNRINPEEKNKKEAGLSCPHCGYMQAKAVIKEHPLTHNCNKCRKEFSAQRINGVIVTIKK